MTAAASPILLGINVDPGVNSHEQAFARARIADDYGLDLITLMDHPYNPRLFDTWTLLTALAMRTSRVHLGTNVLTLPLRPPAMLAKAAATLDVLSGGRVELGIGAGAFGERIESFGGTFGSPAERFQGFQEAIEIIRGLWQQAGKSFSYDGEVYQTKGARPGPAPAHPIRIWTGATGPRMLRLTGRLADGVLVSNSYVPVDALSEVNRLIDEGAAGAGRSPTDVRRGYNLMGVLTLDGDTGSAKARKPGVIVASAAEWVDSIVRLHRDYRQDTFLFWPVAGDELAQIEAFARVVVPEIRARLT
jgi:alkanesulfonate monooxygenase SsuD/methylene tetrahydromethanopterin reductase-like flavin-dependent oxidoreductase (luciferase family)